MNAKPVKSQPETHRKTCQICGEEYTYPEKGMNATRYLCAPCHDLPAYAKEVLTKMGARLAKLERKVERLRKASQP